MGNLEEKSKEEIKKEEIKKEEIKKEEDFIEEEDKEEVLKFKKQIDIDSYYGIKFLNDGRIVGINNKTSSIVICDKNCEIELKINIIKGREHISSFFVTKIDHIIFTIDNLSWRKENMCHIIKIIKLTPDKKYKIIFIKNFKTDTDFKYIEYSKGFIFCKIIKPKLSLYFYENNHDTYQLIRKIDTELGGGITGFGIHNLNDKMLILKYGEKLSFYNFYKGNFLFNYSSNKKECIDDICLYSKNIILITTWNYTYGQVILFDYKKRIKIQTISHNFIEHYHKIDFFYKGYIFIKLKKGFGIFKISNDKLKKIQYISAPVEKRYSIFVQGKYLYLYLNFELDSITKILIYEIN